MVKTRLNKSNRDAITSYIYNGFNERSQLGKRKNFISIIDIWDVQFELQEKFNISDKASEKITWELIRKERNG